MPPRCTRALTFGILGSWSAPKRLQQKKNQAITIQKYYRRHYHRRRYLVRRNEHREAMRLKRLKQEEARKAEEARVQAEAERRRQAAVQAVSAGGDFRRPGWRT